MKFLLLLLLLVSVPSMAVSDRVGVVESTVTATTTSTKVLNYNASRSYLMIQNQGLTNVTVKFRSVQSGSEGVLIVPGGNYEPYRVPIEAMWIISASSTDAVEIVEGSW